MRQKLRKGKSYRQHERLAEGSRNSTILTRWKPQVEDPYGADAELYQESLKILRNAWRSWRIA
jgi:hypothetical protein